MYASILAYCKRATQLFENIPTSRRQDLTTLAKILQAERALQPASQLMFICTHNSRRSHFGQVWAQVAASYYGLADVASFSGGTEATAVHTNTIGAFERAGFSITAATTTDNPKYCLSYASQQPQVICYSKVYDHPKNPDQNFIAVMTCDAAAQNCPLVLGATHRFALTYEDPKVADGTPQEAAIYDARCLQIAMEMLFLFHLISVK